MNIDKEQIYDEAERFLDSASQTMKLQQFSLKSNWDIDHICYRTSSNEVYEQVKNQFTAFSELLAETEVNGRLISTFRLAEAIIFDQWQIDLIEVPAPKKGKSYQDGFEHIEVVCDLTFAELIDAFPNCRHNDAGLGKDFNQELEFNFDNFAVKFHHLSLQSVVNIEMNQMLMSALKKSGILRLLRPYHPLIAGSLPLGLAVSSSDCDIIIEVDDFAKTEKHLHDLFSGLPGFKLWQRSDQSVPEMIASFFVDEVHFEIFCQKIPSMKQTAYKHFLAEERILKYAGLPFAELVLQERRQGLKTEAAFAKILRLEGNPFDAMSSLQKKSRAEILWLVDKAAPFNLRRP